MIGLSIFLGIFLVGIILVPNVYAQDFEVPSWIKNNAGWWANGQIDDSSFLNGIQYLIKEGIMVVSITETTESAGSQEVPSWIKNNAGWWADGLIDDSSFVSGIEWLVSNGIIVVEDKLIHTDTNFRVAFIGDQGLDSNAIAVLNLIKDEGAQMVLHQGDLDYEDNPDAWDKMISNVLGDDFPYFVSIGSHDKLKWDEYQQKLYDRLKKIPDAKCTGDLGVKSSCIYKGLYFIQVGPGLKGSGHSAFIESQLNNNDHIWRICSWAKNMTEMQLGQKANVAGWEVYENCKNHGAIIATAHEHTYSRTKTLIDIENQIIDAQWSEPDKLRVKENSTFVFVSGIGGESIRNQDRCLPFSYPYGCNGEWASIYTKDQDADFGALFCTFNAGGQPNKADCYLKNIQGKIIDKFTVTNFVGVDNTNSNLSEIDLSSKDLSGRNLTGIILIGADLSDTNLVSADLSGKYLVDTILTGADLSNSNLTGADLSGKDLTYTILTGADLSNSNLTGADLSGKDLTGMILRGAGLTDVDLTGTVLIGADLSDANLTGFDFYGKDLTGITLVGADLSHANLYNFDLSGLDLSYANLSGQDLSAHDLTNVILTGANLSNSILPDNGLSKKNFQETIFDGVDLSGKDLSESDFSSASFVNTDMRNTTLKASIFLTVDFTKIKNKSLAGADLSDASFAHSNLSGVNMSDVIMDRTNFWKADLSGVDFTVIPVNQKENHISGTTFIEANLSNSNFDGVDLSPRQMFFNIFENKAYLIRDQTQSAENESVIRNNLFTKFSHVLIISAEVRGNDLAVKYIYFSDFNRANLENANFKNAGLNHANFYQSNLANAFLGGADLTNAFLGGADLTNANLSGANLDGVIMDVLTILKCKNHQVCKNS